MTIVDGVRVFSPEEDQLWNDDCRIDFGEYEGWYANVRDLLICESSDGAVKCILPQDKEAFETENPDWSVFG